MFSVAPTFDTRMENTTMPISPVIDEGPCDSNNEIYNYALYGCSAFIILVLTILERRTNREKYGCFGGHPGLADAADGTNVLQCSDTEPVNLLDHNNDRLSFAAAFGSMASVCFKLFTSTDTQLAKAPAWSKTLFVMASVLSYGLLYYPVFACLSTKWIFVGNFLGAGFSTCLFLLNLRIVVQCAGDQEEIVPGQTIATQTPVLVCLLFLILRFIWKFIYHAYRTAKQRHTMQQEERRLAEPHNFVYVKNLLYSANYSSSEEYTALNNMNSPPTQGQLRATWKKFSRSFYQNDPLFKYSPKIIAIFVVSIICIYQFSIIILLSVSLIAEILKDISNSKNGTTNTTSGGSDTDFNAIFEVRLFLKVFMGSILFSFTVSLLFTIWSTFQILTNYRTTMKRMFKGDFKALHFKRSDFYAQTILCDSLSYAGSQIAYLLWGYLVSLVFLTIVCILITYLVILPLSGDVPFSVFKYIVLNIVPGIVIIGVFRVLQFLGSRLLIQKVDTLDDTGQATRVGVLAIDNRKAFHNVSFFLFLFYIVLGLFACFFTILKGIVLGVLYLSRLDRCRLMSGFESFDAAYLYFIGFLYVEESHRHPVLLVFCDTLTEKHRLKESVKLHNVSSTSPSSCRYSTFDSPSLGRSLSTLPRARIRWLKTYTLVRNPSLVIEEENGFEKVEPKNNISNGSARQNVLL